MILLSFCALPFLRRVLLMTYDVHYNQAINYRQDVVYAKELYRFLLHIIKEKKNKHLPLLHWYAAHLSLLEGDHEACRIHLYDAKKATRLPASVKTQIRINELLLALQTEKRFGTSTEKKTFPFCKHWQKNWAFTTRTL